MINRFHAPPKSWMALPFSPASVIDKMSKKEDDESFSYEDEIPEKYREKIESLAFRSLCEHLRERSDVVSNIDLMSTAGFCRNCLAKWLVLAARTVASQQLQEEQTPRTNQDRLTLQSLDLFEYKKAAKVVYGCSYTDWKTRYLKKASEEQMKRYEESTAIHARHDDQLLKPREGTPFPPTPISSNVCCQDVDHSHSSSSTLMSTIMPTRDNECKVDYISEVPNQLLSSYFTGFVDVIQVGILTVSDRAATNSYIHGDLSGPAVERSIQAVFDTLNECNQQRLSYNIHHKDIVPDDEDQIVDKLIAWSDYDHPSQSSSTLSIKCDIILTTGGTGFSPRDHTPEATAKVLDMECRGLMTWVYSECTKKQPLACLSRGIAGVRNKTLIANLPGNPQGVHDVIVKLLPLLLHALKDIRDYAS